MTSALNLSTHINTWNRPWPNCTRFQLLTMNRSTSRSVDRLSFSLFTDSTRSLSSAIPTQTSACRLSILHWSNYVTLCKTNDRVFLRTNQSLLQRFRQKHHSFEIVVFVVLIFFILSMVPSRNLFKVNKCNRTAREPERESEREKQQTALDVDV